MARKITITKEPPATEKVDIDCGACKRSTKHTILDSHKLYGDEDDGGGWSFQWIEKFQLIQCNGCETISFRKLESNSEDTDIDESGNEYHPDRESLYPSRVEGRSPVQDTQLLPAKIQTIYLETLQALNGSQRVLTGLGIRTLIEGICKDKKAKGANLFQKLNDLVVQGVLTKDGADILQKLRVMGNDAAHDVKPQEISQLDLAMDVVDHLLQGTYILPHHAKKKFK